VSLTEINKQLAAMPDVGTAAGKKIGDNIADGVLTHPVPARRSARTSSPVSATGRKGAAGQVKTRLSERLGAQVGSVVGRVSVAPGAIKLGNSR
jgi:hypothetical protein